MIIRETNINDFNDIYLLNKNGLGYDYPIEKTKEKLQIILNLPTDRIFVAEIDLNIVGYIHLSGYECSYCDSLKNVLAIVVDENYRNMGIGKKLIQTAEAWTKEVGSNGIRLVSGFNRIDAHKFYIRCGYIMRKEQKNFIKWL